MGAPSPHPNALAHHTVRLHRPFFRGPLVQEEAIPDRKLKYFSSKNPATSACFWRFLGSTGRTRNGGRVCWGRSQRPVLGPAAPGGGLSNGNLSASTLPPSTLPCPPYLPRSPLSSSLGKSRAGKEPRPSRDPKSGPAGLEQWSGKLVKRFFSPAYSPICWWPPACPVTGWAGQKARRQTDNQKSSYPPAATRHYHILFQSHRLSILNQNQGRLQSFTPLAIFVRRMRLDG